MLQNIALGTYYPGDSLLHRLQARTKLLALIWLVLFLAAANQREWHFTPYAVVGACVCGGVALSGISPIHIWRRMWLLVLLAAAAGLVGLLFAEDDRPPLYVLGPLVISYSGAWLLTTAFVVFVALYALALLLTMTTTPVALVEGLTMLLAPLRRLRLPVDDFALMTLLALRFVPTLLEEADQLVKAQAARGADATTGGLGRRLRSLGGLLVPLMRGAWRRAEELAVALEARGYADAGQQTPLHEGTLGATDYAVLVLVVGITLGSLLI